MRICIVARNTVPIPPYGYGGSERVIFNLIKGLKDLGHYVVLFANKESVTPADLLIPYPSNFEDNDICEYVERQIEGLNIDIIHDHTEFIMDAKDYRGKFKDIPVIFTLHYPSKSNYPYENTIYPTEFIRERTCGIRTLDNVVYHGIDVNDFKFKEDKEDYLLCMGVVKANKGTHLAIEIAKRLDMKLKIVGPQDTDDPGLTYFNRYIKPELNDKIEYCGCYGGEERLEVLANAKLMLFPTQQIESCGLVALESMASGTPVIMIDNCTGKELLPKECIGVDVEHLIDIIGENNFPTSSDLRKFVDDKFPIERMVRDYERLYKQLIENGRLDSKELKDITISLCMICKNEEEKIGNCLESVKDIVDEIIVVDTGSTDKTKEIVARYTDKIYDFKWVYDFSKARNYALRYATGDFVLWLDSDDVFVEEDILKFIELKRLMKDELKDVDLYWLYYDYRHDKFGNTTYTFQNERMFRNHRGITWNCVVHEVLDYRNKIGMHYRPNIRVTHTSNHDNTKSYVDFFAKNEALGKELNSREKYFYCMEVFKHNMVDKAYELIQSILENPDRLNSYEMHSTYSMKGSIERDRGDYQQAVISYGNSIAYHQPLPHLLYDIAGCYRAMHNFDHAIYYYKSLIYELPFRERFSNNSCYTDHDRDLRKYKIEALLSMIMIEYYDLKRPEMAKKYNDILLEYDPTNESAIYNKGVL